MAASDAGALKARQLKLDANAFDSDDFVQRLLRFMGIQNMAGRRTRTQQADNDATELGDRPEEWWSLVGRELGKHSRRVTTSDHMYVLNYCGRQWKTR
jgi:hypothetical protein